MKKEIYRGRIITLYKESVRLPNGRVAEFDIIRHPGACAIIPITDKGEVIHIYLAKGLIPKKTCHDFDEVMTVKKIPTKKIKKMILDGKIVDSKTLAGGMNA